MQWQICLEILSSAFRKKGLHKKQFRSERELMSCVLIDSDIREIIFSWLKEHETKKQHKSFVKAREFKEIGNEEFKQKRYSQSLESYTKSAVYAPKGSDELCLAIANRSASLFYLNRFNDCIQDTDVAIALGHPVALRYKLLLRQGQCYVNLGDYKATQEIISQLQIVLDNSKDIAKSLKDDIRRRITDLLSDISKGRTSAESSILEGFCETKPTLAYGKNEEFPYASACIDRVYSNEKGMHVLANRDIKRGDILFMEKPVTYVLIDQEKSNDICSNCCKSCRNISVPCAECLNTIYCGLDCANTAWSSYHCWECAGNQIDIWNDVGIAHLALKVLLVCTTTTNYTMFNAMQNLVTNFEKISAGDLIVYSITAAMLTLYLSEYTNYFKVNDFEQCLEQKLTDKTRGAACDVSSDNNKELYISSFLLRHILQLISNGHAISKFSASVEGRSGFVWHQDIIATGIYPSASIMNHSCDPNIINTFMNEILIVRAAKNIAKGEEVFNCYGPHYRRLPTRERQILLMSQYCFACMCNACTVPELQFFLEKFNGLRCPNCNDAMCVTDLSCKSSLNCINCKFTCSDHQYERMLQKANKVFHTAQQLLDSGMECEALSKLRECLSIREEILYKYHDDIILTLDLMGEAYVLTDQWLNAISCQERTIPAVAEKWGSLSIELATELKKFVDVCYAYLRSKYNTNSRSCKDITEKIQSYLNQIAEIVDFNYGSWSKEYSMAMKKNEESLNNLLNDCHI